jgi:hypothetical protein
VRGVSRHSRRALCASGGGCSAQKALCAAHCCALPSGGCRPRPPEEGCALSPLPSQRLPSPLCQHGGEDSPFAETPHGPMGAQHRGKGQRSRWRLRTLAVFVTTSARAKFQIPPISGSYLIWKILGPSGLKNRQIRRLSSIHRKVCYYSRSKQVTRDRGSQPQKRVPTAQHRSPARRQLVFGQRPRSTAQLQNVLVGFGLRRFLKSHLVHRVGN